MFDTEVDEVGRREKEKTARACGISRKSIDFKNIFGCNENREH